MSTSIRQTKLVVSGKVQGVGFRYFIKIEADRLSLTGWVKNENNGDVEVFIQGTEPNIEQLIETIQQKPPLFAKVKDIHVQHLIFETEHNIFKILYR